MKLAIIPVLALATAALGVTKPQKAIIVTYPKKTPKNIVTDAMKAITDAGGKITHEYQLIMYVFLFCSGLSTNVIYRGFAAEAPVNFLPDLQALGNKYGAEVEEDQMVSINGGVAA